MQWKRSASVRLPTERSGPGLFLERERIVNHLGDLGAICNDVAFAFLLYQFHRLKEMLIRTNLKLFGHRFLMDRIVLGGTTVDIDVEGVITIRTELDWLAKEFERLVVIYDENPSVEDRVRDTGILSPENARNLGMVGFVARASGLNLDCRIHQPFPPYDRISVNATVLISGDVHARASVRVRKSGIPSGLSDRYWTRCPMELSLHR